MSKPPRFPRLRNAALRLNTTKGRSVAWALVVAVLPGGGVLLLLWLVATRSKRRRVVSSE